MKPIVVIGGGHNGLAAAATVARSGRKVIVLEARDSLGGLAARRTFHEGYSAPGVLHDTSLLRPRLLRGLDLERHGLSWREAPDIAAPSSNGETLWIGKNDVAGVDGTNQAAYRSWMAFIERVSGVIANLMDQPPPDPVGEVWPLFWTGLKIRRLGSSDMTELLRVGPMCVADWLRDQFSNERLSAALALPAVTGLFTGPWSAGTAAILLLQQALAGREVVGGPAALIDALEKVARARQVEFRTSAPVERIVISNQTITGVVVAGETIDCDTVIASCDPKQTFAQLIGEHRLPVALASDIHNLRVRGSTAKVHLALDAPLTIDAKQVEALRTGETLDAIEQAFDPMKYRQLTTRPALDVRVWSGDGIAPNGAAVASLMVHGVAYHLEQPWDDAAREAVASNAIAALAQVCPTVRDHIVGHEVLSPADLAAEYRLTGGHLHHGEHGLDQLAFMRPTVDCARYSTPIKGLFLGGSGSHPGGGIRCVPGILAAKAVLAG